MLQRRSSGNRVVPTSPGPTYMTNEQMADYLKALRTTRITRPHGSRPLPSSALHRNLDGPNTQHPGYEPSCTDVRRGSIASRSSGTSTKSHTVGEIQPGQDIRDVVAYGGELATERAGIHRTRTNGGLRNSTEADLQRLSLSEVSQEEEDRIIAAAKDESEELIRKHKFPEIPYCANPLPSNSRSHSQPTSLETPSLDIERPVPQPERSMTEPFTVPSVSKQSTYAKIAGIWGPADPSQRRRSSGKRSASGKHKSLFVNPTDKIFEDPTETEAAPSLVTREPAEIKAADPPQGSIHVRKNPFARVRAARESSGDTLPRPYIVPAGKGIVQGTPVQFHNSESSARAGLEAAEKQATEETTTKDSEEIKYQNGVEVRSDELRAATSFRRSDKSAKLPSPTAVSDSIKRPIVSFRPDWTPPKLEEERLGHDSRGTPTKRPSPVPQRLQGYSDDEPVKSVSAPAVPTISNTHRSSIQLNNGRLVGDLFGSTRSKSRPHESFPPPAEIPSMNVPSVPSISVWEAPHVPAPTHQHSPVPAIVFPEEAQPHIPSTNVSEALSFQQPQDASTSRAKTRPHNHRLSPDRPLPIHSATTPLPTCSKAQWNTSNANSVRRTTALCAQCALPISGKVVTAASTRFHPDCFTCHACATPLECVAFYPEPAERRTARLERIAAREAGEDVPDGDARGDYAAEDADGDDSLRFYCHLDFHELFSPRCKSCKTPIEGEVVVACGAEWHVGHFFCAECGDPFDSSTPFVEREGYAWCVGCHTRRFSGKCAGCMRPVSEQGVKAEGREWHFACWVCGICSQTFDDGQYYLVGDSQVPICSVCQDMRLKE